MIALGDCCGKLWNIKKKGEEFFLTFCICIIVIVLFLSDIRSVQMMTVKSVRQQNQPRKAECLVAYIPEICKNKDYP